MKTRLHSCLLALTLVLTTLTAAAQSPSFTYQGFLTDQGANANGVYDLRFTLFDAPDAGTALVVPLPATNPIVVSDFTIRNGLFTIRLNFGATPFKGADVFLEVAVRPGASTGAFTPVTPRQKFTPTPYAVHAVEAKSLTGPVKADQLTGTYTSAVNFNNPANRFTGNGAGLTGVPASGLAAGTYGNILTFPNAANRFTGFFTGNGSGLNGVTAAGLGAGTFGNVLNFPNAANRFTGIFTGNGAGLTGVSVSGLAAGIYPDAYNFNNALNRFAGTFVGNGAGLTGVNVSGLAAGTYGNEVNFNNPNNRFTGRFTGEGPGLTGVTASFLLGGAYGNVLIFNNPANRFTGSGIGLTSLDALALQGTVHDGNLSANVARLNGGGTFTEATTFDAATLFNRDVTILGNVGIGIEPRRPFFTVASSYYGKGHISLHSADGEGKDGSAFISAQDLSTEGSAVRLILGAGANGNAGPGIVISPLGTVSVGPIPNTSTLEPKATLQVHGDYYGRGHLYLHAFEGDGQNGTAYIQARDLPNGRPPSSSIRMVLRTQFNGEVRNGIEISPDGNTVKLHVLEILGGADVAEPFPVGSADVPKGAVLVIDEEHPGQLKLSDRAYDTRVAGIVSGANGVKPGLTLSQQGVLEGGQNVALSGRVYVLADAANAPIRPGDLLTTSAVFGHAMKATDTAKAQGAIIGKAMSRLDAGKGMVLVLVTLQ